MPLINKGNAEHYPWGSGCDGWRLLNRSDLAVIQERVPPGLGEVKHYHAKSRQLFFVLQGSLEITIGEERLELREGDSLEISPTITHRIWNPFDKDASFLVVSAPSTTNDRVYLESSPPR